MKLASILGLALVGVACTSSTAGTDTDATTATGSTSSTTEASGSTTGSSGSSTDALTSTDPTTSTGTTTLDPTTDSSTTDEPIPEACTCYGDCGPELCPEVTSTCEDYCGDTPEVVSDEAALQCMIEALRDRTHGRLRWGSGQNGFQFGVRVRVQILADGTAVTRPLGYSDLCTSTGPDRHVSLKDPSYFEGCLAIADPVERFDCAVAMTEENLAMCSRAVENCGDL